MRVLKISGTNGEPWCQDPSRRAPLFPRPDRPVSGGLLLNFLGVCKIFQNPSNKFSLPLPFVWFCLGQSPSYCSFASLSKYRFLIGFGGRSSPRQLTSRSRLRSGHCFLYSPSVSHSWTRAHAGPMAWNSPTTIHTVSGHSLNQGFATLTAN